MRSRARRGAGSVRTPPTATSLYKGGYHDRSRFSEDPAAEPYVVTATIEAHLHQLGAGPPVITLALRHYADNNEQQYDNERLRLSTDDAREFITALTYMVETAERG
jgi:hypothetical protein